MVGKVEEYLFRRIAEDRAIHITLIDPEDQTPKSASFLARESEVGRSSAIMIGGSTIVLLSLIHI